MMTCIRCICCLIWLTVPALLCGQVTFTADTTAGCGPLTVQFTADAPGATNVFWDFGDNTSSAIPNPVKIFTRAGTYTISMRAIFPSGPPVVTTRSAYIEVYGPPIADFSANLHQICAGTPIIFTDNSTAGSSNITQWHWNFGDGRVSGQSNPIHTYSGRGLFTVSLQVIDANGCTDIRDKLSYIQVNKPDASFTYNNIFDCNPPLTSTFSSRSSPTSTHVWLFGLGSSTQPNPSYTFNTPGLYNVTHIVTDSSGCADTVLIRDLVQVGQLNVQVRASRPRACIKDPIQFFCGSNLASSVSWNLGPAGTSTSCNPTVSYSTPGTFTVTATLTFPSGCVINGSTTVTILPLPDIRLATPDTFACDPPLISRFTSTVANAPPGSLYTWEFGDNTFPSNVVNPAHTYQRPGNFDVTLTVVTPDGCRDSVVEEDRVKINLLAPDFIADPAEGCLPLDVDFTSTSLSSSPLSRIDWDFGNGQTASGPMPSTTYLQRGNYTVKLYVSNQDGCTDSLIQYNYIAVGDSVKALFEPVDTLICGGMPLQFQDSSRGNVTGWQWLFGDGNTSDLQDPSHKFRDTGYLAVTLIVSDNGCKDTLVVDSAVYVKPVIASIGGLFIGCDTPFVAKFYNPSKGGHIWHWNFGTGNPGDTSDLKSPTFTYHQIGDFWASLIAVDTVTGCVDSMRRLVQVEPIDLTATADTTFGCTPITVSFSASSNHAIAQRWVFGDGSYGNALNVTHTYKKPGNFIAGLTAWNRIGCSAAKAFRIYSHRPVVNFHVQDTNGCAPFAPVWTNATSSNIPVRSWRWDLGNGFSSNSRIPAPIYPQGHFSVKLLATDSLGCTDSLRKAAYIFVSDPAAGFSVRDSINCIGKQNIFRAFLFGRSIVLTDWDFGDNTTSTVPTVVHSYAANGNYTVTLTVTDSIGCTDSASKQMLIQDPHIDLLADTVFSTCPPLRVNFTGDVQSPHTFVRWEWDFGDGNTSNTQNPTYIYTRPGTYTVKVKAYSITGCVDSVTLVDYITVQGPDGYLDFWPKEGCAGTEVAFSAVDSNTVSSSCDLGDGTLAQGTPVLSSFNKVYPNPGVYKPVLLLDDGKGCVFPVIPKDSIVIYPNPQADFTAHQRVLCQSGTVQFVDLSTSPSQIASWQWKFGDGFSSASPNPSHFYPLPDTYTVTLIVTTVDGCVDSLKMPAFIEVRELPEVDMMLSDTVGCAPFTLRLSDNSPASNAPIANWDWQSGYGGGQATGAQTQFSYPVAGFYTINLQITDTFGCQNDLDTTIHVLPPPEVDFGVMPDSFGCAAAQLQFRDRLRSGVGWRWDFGDGGSSVLQDPIYTFKQDGIYDVKLVVVDSRGCTDSLIKPAYIRLGHPQADFSFAPAAGCPPLEVNFQDISLTDTSLVSWRWDFGDANTGTGANPQHTYMQPGSYSVRLIVEDAFGCMDTLLKENIIRVREDIRPVPPEIRRVTVLSDASVRVEWEPFSNPNNDFERYELYREDAGNWVKVFSSPSILTSQFDETGLNTTDQSYCYKLVVVNNCERLSELDSSNTHCSIQLTTSSLPESIQLDWSAYVGFEVAAYQIYRVSGYGINDAEWIATVGPETLSYLDEDMFCYDEVTYRIQANKAGENLFSLSNISTEAPVHQPPTQQEDLVRATVEDNRWVKVEWKNIRIERAKTFFLEKNEGTGYRTILSLPVSQAGNSFRDDQVEVSRQAYLYRAYWEDSCGDRTTYGLPGSSIHLTAERKQGTVFLDWSSYKTWAGGVSSYQIELFDQAAGAFFPLARVQASDTSYQDKSSELEQDNYCYRIRAFERGGNDTLSLSNEACVSILPQLFAPNAFSPNGDGYNDEFLIKGAFLQTFNLKIFSRWGHVVFETQDQEEGWDGRYKEKDVPEGVYVFFVNGIGLDGSPVHLRGTVTLIR